jgi:lysophospholipase L1-like esterase
MIGSVILLSCGGHAVQAQAPVWIGTWAASPVRAPSYSGHLGLGGVTYRNTMHVSVGGTHLRVYVTNEFGVDPLRVGAAHIAISAGNGSIQPSSDHPLSFGGHGGVEIPAGSFMMSDPVGLQVAPLSDLVVSVYLPEQPMEHNTCHPGALSTQYLIRGNQTAAPVVETFRTTSDMLSEWCFVKRIDVQNTSNHDGAVVILGDSIAAGGGSTPNTNRRWTDVLAARLQADKRTANLGVLNEGVGGNSLLRDGSTPSALARFDRDVIAQGGIKYLIMDEGLNDIRGIAHTQSSESKISADDIVFAWSQLVIRAHQHGIKVFGATLTPHKDEHSGYSPEGERVREACNKWVRESGFFDGVIDFDSVTQDPADPERLRPDYDSGEHLHPNDAGYKGMGAAIDLSLFR